MMHKDLPKPKKIGKQETRVYRGRPVLSDQQLLDLLQQRAQDLFPDEAEVGRAKVVESAYSGVWYSHPQYAEHLIKKISWLVHNSV
jgi:hypothetical protein